LDKNKRWIRINVDYFNGSKLKIKFKQKFKNWHGISTLMQGGWKLLPVRVEAFNWNWLDDGFDKILEKQIREALQKYKISIKRVNAFSMHSNGDVLFQDKIACLTINFRNKP
jgi:hypothetical protein